MKPLNRTRQLAGISLLLTAGVLILIFRPSPLVVDSAFVRRGPLQVTLDAEGVTRVVDRFAVAAPVPGKLLRIRFAEGDSVKKGLPVAAIMPPELNSREHEEAHARAGSARAALQEVLSRQRQVSVTLGQAALRSARYRALYREGAVSKEAFELAQNEAAVLEKERQAAAAAVEAARYNLSALLASIDRSVSGKAVSVLSPVDGRILRIHEKSERVVPAGTPLFDIGDPERIEIVIDVLSSDAVRVKPGNTVLVEDWGGEVPLRGMVRTVEPAAFTRISALGIEEKRVNIITVLAGREPGLGDNFRVQSKIVIWEAENVLKVPTGSLFRGKGEWNVFVIEGGRAKVRKVVIGMRGAYDAEVLGGLKDGDHVVVHPTNELQNGMRVRVP
jgi:HlyD family secretion protein